MKIPAIIHQIWLGARPIPEGLAGYMQSWQHYHPGWEHRLWTNGDLPSLLSTMETAGAFEAEQNPALLSDLLRVELLHRFGGLYVDCDFECLQPFLAWALRDGCFHYGDQAQGCPGSAWLSAPPGHPFLRVLLSKLARNVNGKQVPGMAGVRDEIYNLTGPGCLKRTLDYYVEKWGSPQSLTHPETGRIAANFYEPDVVAFLTESLHPYFYTESWNPESHPQALAVHHWAGSWFH